MVAREVLKASYSLCSASRWKLYFDILQIKHKYEEIFLQANYNLHGAPGCSPTLPCSPLNPLPPVNRSLSFAYSFSRVFILAFSPLISTQSNQTSSHKWLLWEFLLLTLAVYMYYSHSISFQILSHKPNHFPSSLLKWSPQLRLWSSSL